MNQLERRGIFDQEQSSNLPNTRYVTYFLFVDLVERIHPIQCLNKLRKFSKQTINSNLACIGMRVHCYSNKESNKQCFHF